MLKKTFFCFLPWFSFIFIFITFRNLRLTTIGDYLAILLSSALSIVNPLVSGAKSPFAKVSLFFILFIFWSVFFYFFGFFLVYLVYGDAL